ncbi:MAG TPA: hypothetical protein VLN49_19185 [Gemmatimonadaceae bacterium]|nr:hypothetical protein [Gemmatimonadaceae bacterium]
MKARSALWLFMVMAAPTASAQLGSTNVAPWSPLAPRADLPRTLPNAGADAWSLWFAPLSPGIFAGAGNPAGLAWETPGSRSEYSISRRNQTGRFHRPFDPERATTSEISASSYKTLPPSGNVLGEVVAANERYSPGPRSDGSPFGSSPFVLADTAAAAMTATRARLAGAGGWRIGSWGAGIAAGYDASDLHSDETGFVRRGRFSMSGLTLGAARQLAAPLPLVVGAHAGVCRNAESVGVTARDAPGQLFDIQGYREAPRVDVPLAQFYSHRLDARSAFGGAQLAASVRGADVVLGAELSRRADATSHEQRAGAPVDRWSAHGASYHVMAARSFAALGQLRVAAHSTNVSGAATAAGDSAATFRARERSSAAVVELRSQVSPSVRTLATITMIDERRERRDSIAQAVTNLHARYPVIGFAMGVKLSERGELLVGLTATWYRSAGTIPLRVESLSYDRFLEPEIALYATSMQSTAAQGGLRWRLGNQAFVSVLAQRTTLLRDGFPQFPDVLPTGARAAAELRAQITTHPK